jgi:hypothetical protein
MKWLVPLIIIIILIIFGSWFCTHHPDAKAEAQEYEIKIYEFNKDTGHGSAYIKLEGAKKDTSDPDPKIPIIVEKYTANKASTFTGSAHEDAFIKVKGILTKEDGRPAALTVVNNE